jgi:hypothetical protein
VFVLASKNQRTITKTLTYYATEFIIAVKSFMIQVHVLLAKWLVDEGTIGQIVSSRV